MAAPQVLWSTLISLLQALASLLGLLLGIAIYLVVVPITTTWAWLRMSWVLCRVWLLGGKPKLMALAGARGWCLVIKALLARGISANTPDAAGSTALMLAASNNRVAAVKLL